MFKEWSKVVQDLNTNRNKSNIEKAEKLHSKVRAAYMKKLLPGLDKK